MEDHRKAGEVPYEGEEKVRHGIYREMFSEEGRGDGRTPVEREIY